MTQAHQSMALGPDRYVEFAPVPGGFALAQPDQTTTLYVDRENDYPGVVRAVHDLCADLQRVTGRTPGVVHDASRLSRQAVIIGTIGRSALIDRLIDQGRLDVSGVRGRWEAFVIQVLPEPMPGVSDALVIAGSDRRGTIFGVYDLSEQIGVSPWYWWADVPVRRHDTIFVRPGVCTRQQPAVRYRGIFLNDEEPALSGWVWEKFGDYNHRFYTKVFELLLRLKGNYLWPAMWGSAFNEDDPLNPRLADEYGIVMGTSHHEPMLRAQQEWKRHGTGPWNYATNAQVLRAFWDEGIRRNRDYESIITIGMRGDGDEPMSEEANVALLQRIITDQRRIIAERIDPDVTKVPQLWALYKEVQEYYEKGMRVPEDVTLLWCDDNWGNIRRLPTEAERKRPGGAGIYYHFDYVGGPRSYKWLNTVPISRIWEQMNLAMEHGADRIWIVNVGDLKPLEFPIEFFLRMAWDPRAWPKEKLAEYTRLWARREFGPEHASTIAEIISKYTKYNGRRKPELVEPDTFSLLNYNEADRVLAEWKQIVEQAERVYQELSPQAKDAFYQLVLHPTKASALVTEINITAGRNRLYAGQGRASANELAAQVRELFRRDEELTRYYNRELAGGKWNHLMDQTHIGHTFWNQPPRNVMPAVSQVQVSEEAEMGVAAEGTAICPWPGMPGQIVLPPFDAFNRQRRWIDVFNRGRQPFDYVVTTSDRWIQLSSAGGRIESQDQRLWVTIDWEQAPQGHSRGWVKIERPGHRAADAVHIWLSTFKPSESDARALRGFRGFIEGEGFVSMEAEHFARRIDTDQARWEAIPDYGRTLSAMTIVPVTSASVMPPDRSPRLEYDVYLFTSGELAVEATVAPTLDYLPGRGLRLGISFDDQPPQVVDALADRSQQAWEQAVKDNARVVRSVHRLDRPGYHTLKVWMVDAGVVLEKLLINCGGVRSSYLGPPESFLARG
ncbi:glycosyl hydrolase 115 family protein [Fontivita pretiosa]|uniref:glycosyl hydrolase 115 family protein n=1 Tax=Fontivita pretiosa TaxID=2989684 RepID=UPI003D1865E0